MNIDTSGAPKLTKKGLHLYLDDCIADGTTPMIWGPPGCAKSQTVADYAAANDFRLVHRHWGQYAIHSAAGIPIPDTETRQTYFTEADYLTEINTAAEEGKRVLFFMDELPNAPKDVTSVALQLTDERRVGTYRLPDSCAVVAAGNRPEDGAHVCNMPATSANRMAHAVYTGPSVGEFVAWGEATGRLSVEVMGYLQAHPDELYKFDRLHAINNTHRTWEKASRMFDRRRGATIVDADFLNRVSTLIRQATAVDMALTLALADKVVSAVDVLADPEGAPVPSERTDIEAADRLSASYMQIRLLNASLAKSTKDAKKVCTYVARFDPEFRAAFLAMVMQRYNEKRVTVSVIGAVQDHFQAEFLEAVDLSVGGA